jgi:ribonuclease-3
MSEDSLPKGKVVNYRKDYEPIYEAIGYRFQEQSIFREALTHPSSNLSKKNSMKLLEEVGILPKSLTRTPINYERFEFMGDRILSFVIAEAIFKKFKKKNEGEMSKIHSAVVSGKTSYEIGLKLGISDYIIMSEAEFKSGGAKNKSIIENVMEAIICAIYLDGGLPAAKIFIERFWLQAILDYSDADHDPKSLLQKWSQAKHKTLPQYDIISEEGMDHEKTFNISVSIDSHSAIGVGSSKKEAEKDAAKKMIEKLKIDKNF